MLNQAPVRAFSVAFEPNSYKKARPEPRLPFGEVFTSALRRGVDLEPLHGELLDRAVLDGGLDGLVEGLLQVLVFLANAGAHASAEHAAGDGRADQGVVLELG